MNDVPENIDPLVFRGILKFLDVRKQDESNSYTVRFVLEEGCLEGQELQDLLNSIPDGSDPAVMVTFMVIGRDYPRPSDGDGSYTYPFARRILNMVFEGTEFNL